ncbi:metallophosphoesterase [Paratissierella segnis]|uniref:Metallophosphoesterase n=1 Tax=Paratissierella segnis TaxID=2763679 RepID=A0A926ESD4_9FIRM|nr:metallophosphoesterase [Paratissierella segnis]MBC8586776.1 metallophosphoesterase [Paratissierella segnis]
MKTIKIVLIILFSIIFLYLYNYRQISQFYINKIKLSSKKLSKPLKITQITDFHSNELVNIDKLFKKINEFNPDIIAITGDLIDYKTRDLALAIEVIKRSKTVTEKVFFVSGNHEVNNKLENKLYAKLYNQGVVILDNKSEVINVEGNVLNVMGVHFYAEKSDFKKIFHDLNEDRYNLLLSHSPNRPIRFLDNRLDLILSGHTHGGQVRLPIIGAIISPGQGLFPKYDKGIFNFDNTILYIDSGLGNSMANIRLFNRIQITNIEILPN